MDQGSRRCRWIRGAGAAVGLREQERQVDQESRSGSWIKGTRPACVLCAVGDDGVGLLKASPFAVLLRLLRLASLLDQQCSNRCFLDILGFSVSKTWKENSEKIGRRKLDGLLVVFLNSCSNFPAAWWIHQVRRGSDQAGQEA